MSRLLWSTRQQLWSIERFFDVKRSTGTDRRSRALRRPSRGGLRAGIVAALVSGAPSTAHALATGRDPLEATAAAGTLVLRGDRPRDQLVLAAIPAHLALSIAWAFFMTALLPKRNRVFAGAVYGLGIALFDLGVVGRAFPRIRALPLAPQVADHVLFGVIVAALTADHRSASCPNH